MRKYRRDDNGIPFLTRTDIEERAEAVLSFFDRAFLKDPMPTPLGAIAEALNDEHGVYFEFGRGLGLSREGYRYLGRFHIPINAYLHSLRVDTPRLAASGCGKLGV
jgi:hypothetical protein